MSVKFDVVEIPRDRDALGEFLCCDEWPFHGRSRLTADDVAAMEFAGADVSSFWVVDEQDRVGIVRVLDLADIGDGAPLLDVRIAAQHRGRGFGSLATRWIVDYLFASHPELHRIEANTRHDNVAMQRVLAHSAFTLEGRLRESWFGDDGQRFDTLVYGLLRSD